MLKRTLVVLLEAVVTANTDLATGERLVLGGVAHGGHVDELDLRAHMRRTNLATGFGVAPPSPVARTNIFRAAIAYGAQPASASHTTEWG